MDDAEQPKSDPNELMQLPQLTRGEISNLMACIDTVVRGQGLNVAKVLAALAEKVGQAVPAAHSDAEK